MSDAAPLYITRLAGARYLNVGLGLAAVAMLAFGVVGALAASDAAVVFLATTAFGLALIAFVWAVIPQRLEIWPERLRLAFPFFKWDLGLETIETVRETTWWEPYAFAGVRFSTAPGQSVAVIRRQARMIGRPSIIVSPRDRHEFIEAMERAMASGSQA